MRSSLSHAFSFSFRHALAACLAVLALCASTAASAQDKVSLRLNWYLGGLHVPFYYGKERGFFADEKIDLTINEGRGSANTVQVVAAGSDTFGMADSSSVVLTAARGADVKSVMSLLNSTGFSVVSLAETKLKTPKDLEGKRVAVSPGDPLGSLLQAVCKANNVDCSKISMVQVDPAAKVVTVLEKKADALLGGADDQYFLIKQRGVEPAAMRYADWGANIVGMTIVAKTETLQKNPDLVRRFVRASVKSWEEAKKNPGAAVDAALKVKPDLNRQSTLDQLMVDIELLDSKNSKGRIGWGAQADWDQTLNILKQYRDLKTDQAWTAFHTNEFLPK
jgi:NitT/TauT family transport system substrate-binding protein